MSDTPRFWNLMAKRYSRQKIGDPAAYREKLSRTQALFSPQMRVLEVGCGTGGTARLHAAHVAEVHAIDFSDKMIEIAKARQAAEGIENVRFEVSTIDKLTVDNPYDVVMAMSVLHLLPKWKEFVSHVPKQLVPGGYFVSSTVVLEHAPWYLRAFLATLRPFGMAPSLQTIPASKLRDEMIAAGFEILDFWQPNPNTVFAIARRAE